MATYQLSGTIYDAHNVVLQRVTIQAFDQDFRKQELIGEATTDAKGVYKISYDDTQYAHAESGSADIFIRVLDASGAVLGQSDVHFNAASELVLNLKIDSSTTLNEFDTLAQRIKPLIEPQRVSIGELHEDGQYKDIDFLAGETGELREKISFINIAFRLSKETPIAPDIFYGLFRMSFPNKLNELLLITNESILMALQQAIKENIIPSHWSNELDGVAKAFNELAIKKVIDGGDDQSATFKKVMGSVLSADQQRIFTETYFSNEAKPDKFWEQLKLQPGFADGNTIERTKELLHLNRITANQPELTSLLFRIKESDDALKEIRDFTRYSKADWKEKIKEAGVADFPKWVSGNTPEEKIENYAASLEQLHKQLYPTTFFAKRLLKDNQSSFSFKQDLDTFFSKNPEFDLKTTHIHKQFEQSDFNGIPDQEGLKKELKTLHRLFKLTDETDQYETVNALRSKELYSATDIVNKYGEQQFKQQFAIALKGEANAADVYNKAVSANNRVTALLISYWGRYNTKLYAINGTNAVPEDYQKMFGVAMEEYHEMFGDREFCECEQCQSVYSPSAYFVDTMTFIKGKNIEAFNELNKRRPDLDNILLTCKNTNTPLPYIDLVNELLEKEVVKLAAITDTEGITADTHSYQTKGNAAELAAMPEHISSNAYTALQKAEGEAVFSSLLPLDLVLEETRVYTEKLGLGRQELMEVFYGNNEPGKYSDSKLAAELWKLSPSELEIINGEATFSVTMPANIKDLLSHTKLSYIELLQLLETYFLNPKTGNDRLIKITQVVEGNENDQLLTCNLDKLILSGATNEWLNKTIRFVRLWKKLDWDIFDLDRSMTTFKLRDFPTTESAFNEQLFIPLYQIERIHSMLNIPVREVITFFSDIDTATYIDHSKDGQPGSLTLYENLFRNKFISDPVDPAFTANAENLSGDLNLYKEILCAVLRVKETDLFISEGETLSIKSLSRLYREALLAKTLNASASELQSLITITGKHPVDGVWSTLTLLEFLNEWKLFKSTGIATTEFQTHITNKIGADYKLPVKDSLIGFIMQYIEELTQIKNDSTIPESERKNQFNVKIDEFLLELTNNADTDAITSLDNNTLAHADDLLLKGAIENYLGDENKKNLVTLSFEDFLDKLNNLKNSLSDYLLLKTTPLIFKKLGFDSVEMRWLKDEKVGSDTEILWDENINISSPDLYPAFKRILYLSRLDKIKTDSSSSWTDLLKIAIENQGQAKSDFFDAFINLYKVSANSLGFLIGTKNEINNNGRMNLSFPQDYKDAGKLLEILDCCKAMEKLGGSQEQLQSLLKIDVTAEDAQAVKNLLKASYSNKEWLDIIKPINNQSRTKRRDALVAWLLAKNNTKWKSTNDIYEDLLIDVEMDACMITSRIKQAISSVQLFIDRCLMNLEILNTETTDPNDDKTLILGTDFSKQWNAWRKQYAFWEANRKIFLYPENWIEPDLRDGKSPFFKELESQLKQNEVTEETAKEALLTYLGKLDAVANLEVVGLFNDEETKMIHVIGRTHSMPHQYYYRKQQTDHWTPWEKVDLDIEGDHILPVVWNGRLMIFWALFTEKQQDTGGNTSITPEANGSMTMNSTSPTKFLEMKLAWSEYKKGKWGTKKLSKNAINCQNLSFDPDLLLNGLEERDGKENIDYLSLNSSFDNGNLLVHLFYLLPENEPIDKHFKEKGSFLFNNCNSSPVLTSAYQTVAAKIPSGMDYNKMFINGSTNPFSLFLSGTYTNENSNLDPVPIFSKNPSPFHLLPDHHEIEKDKAETFFYKNEAQNFYAYSKEKRMPRVDDYAVDNPGLTVMARRTASPLNTDPTSRLHSNGTPTGISRTIEDVINPDRRKRMNEINEPTRIFFGKKYLFQTFYHPYVCSYIKILNTKGIDDLYTEEVQPIGFKEIFIKGGSYDPTEYVLTPYPEEELDFSYGGSYSLYNWELFFHIPLLIATRLSQNQKFEEARKWFHYIFDPTKSSVNNVGAERFWITKPFKKEILNVTTLEELLNGEDAEDLNKQLNNWASNPFNPNAVARLRVSAYMRNTVLRYIDNLIAWGDQLFKRDTIESINEATQLYILASNILGKKPEQVPARALPDEKSFSDIEGHLDQFSNAKVEIESFISPNSSGEAGENIRMPYFGLPKNDNLLKYWDTVNDRLFKIRHCQNIEGVFRQLPLFEHIDPSLLIRANAAGLDLNSILNDLNISLPHYRFQIMLQKANELCNDVKMLGSSLLSALEKKDAEELALLRSGHELKMFELVRDIKEKQRDEVKENLSSSIISKDIIQRRRDYFTNRINRNQWEDLHFQLMMSSNSVEGLMSINATLASLQSLIPQTNIGPWIMGVQEGGLNLSNATDAVLKGGSFLAASLKTGAELAGTYGAEIRRKEESNYQVATAELELKQIDKQILAAEIRLVIAEKDLENHDRQIEHTREVDDYMRSKFTNAELYDWMVGQISTTYFQTYQLAYSTARKAEKCMQHELGLETNGHIQPGYWDSLKKGLLSGEKLQYDLRRLENAYLEKNKREYELTKHISVAMLDPLALIKLRATGVCDFEIPEALFDIDYAGHYFRRLKSVSVSLPCIAGPYTSVSAKLSLGNNKYRKDLTGTEYIEAPGNDDRFIYNVGAIQSIAASNAQNDSGVFELNFRDERYLPFEGAGAISEWTLELPSEIRQFDYNTITDVIIHVKYTAREGGEDLKEKANLSLMERLNSIKQQLLQTGLHVAINLKHDLPNEWHILTKNGTVNLNIDKSRLPYMVQNLVAEIEDVMFVAKVKNTQASFAITIDTKPPTVLSPVDELKLYKGINSDIKLGTVFSLTVVQPLEELIMVIKYRLNKPPTP